MSTKSSDRWIAIDASRGVAMAFVCLSHFATGYFAGIGHPERQLVTDRIGMLASPAFMLISGSMLGLLFASRSGERFERVRERLFDRGLFLILVAHVLIVIAHLALHDGSRAWIRWGFITDTIGVCLLIGPPLVQRLAMGARLVISFAIYTASWWIVRAWHPGALTLRFVKDTFAGPMGLSTRLYNFPIFPWLAVYLAGNVLGESMVERRARGESAAGIVARVGGAAILLAVVLSLALNAGGLVMPAAEIFTRAADLTSPFQKLPPGPVYLLGYGGLALLMTGLLIFVEERGYGARVMRAPALVGKASLFVFVLQYYVNFVFVPRLHLPDTPWWPLFFLVSLAAIYALAAAWMRAGLNRLITVGYPHSLRRSRILGPAASLSASGPPTTGA